MHHIERARQIYRANGVLGLLSQFLRYVATVVDRSRGFSVSVPGLSQGARPGSMNSIGAVVARLPPPGWNPPVTIPLAKGNECAFERVAVVAHIFYPDLAEEMLSYLNNIPVPYGLFISTDSDEKRNQIEEIASRIAKAVELEIKIVPNVGRDVAPKYIAFREVYSRYPAFLHIHSKKSLYAGGTYQEWRSYLLERLVGTNDIARSNLHLLSQDKVGVVYPQHAGMVRDVINWGYDFDLASALLKRIGVRLDADMILEFPSGSMFWGRSAAIQKLLQLDLELSDFPPEEGQVDGTLAHAIERSLLLFVEASGHQWVRTDLSREAKPIPPARAHFQPILVSRPPISQTTKIAGETIPIPARPVERDRRRFNLLVPTINASQTFGGVDTAMKLFTELCASVSDADFRVLVTDAATQEGIPDRLDGFSLQKLGEEYRSRKVVVECVDRLGCASLEVAPNDVFMATAWWTAHIAFIMQDQQRLLFGVAPRVVYLIQDFEPGFYGWSPRYALAEATYRRPQDTVPIFNSEELELYFAKHYRFPEKRFLRYQPNQKVVKALTSVPRKRIILFYSRPSTARNCFEVGIDGITLWQKRNPVLASKWKVLCVGEVFPKRQAGGLSNFEIAGKLTLDDYADALSSASVGLSLMISPHPSYPPLEMAYAGIKTLTNRYECKDLGLRSSNITSIDEVSANAIAQALEDMVADAEGNIGNITKVRCEINDIETPAEEFSTQWLIELLDNPRDRGMSLSTSQVGAGVA